jgi:hypothetical protein
LPPDIIHFTKFIIPMKPFFTTCSIVFCLFFSLKLAAQIPPACFPANVAPTDECSDACVYCNFNGISSQSGAYGPSGATFCGSIENDQWLGIIANCTTMTFTVTPSNCANGDGCQIALYNDCGTSSPLFCNVGEQSGGLISQSITADNLMIGHTYFVLIDTWAGDICDFSLSATPNNCVIGNALGATGSLSGPDNVCPNGLAQYCLPANVVNSGGYLWQIPADASIDGQPGPGPIARLGANGRCATVAFGPSGGTKLVCVRPVNSCFEGEIACKNVQIVPIPTTILPNDTICIEDAANYELPWGDSIFAIVGTISYQTSISTVLDCDSILVKSVTIESSGNTILPPKTLCFGECLSINGQNFCNSGDFSTIFPKTGCDSVVSFHLTVLHPIAEILGKNTICGSQPILLNSAPPILGDFPEKIWKNDAGQIISDSASAIISTAGTYILEVFLTKNGVICTKSDTILVQIEPQLILLAVGDTIRCATPNAVLHASASIAGTTFFWSGANNFQSNLAAPTVTAAGIYFVKATSPAGCTATDSVQVSLENKLNTFILSPNPAKISLQPAATTNVLLPANIQNLEQNPIEIVWTRTFVSLTPNCQTSVEDKFGLYPTSYQTGSFELATGEIAPLGVRLFDASATICCGVVHLSIRNSCTLRDTATLVFIESCTSATESADFSSFKIWPNPSSGNFYLENLPETAVSIQVVSLNGQIILEEKIADNHSFSIKNQPSGTYFLLIKNDLEQPMNVVELVLKN